MAWRSSGITGASATRSERRSLSVVAAAVGARVRHPGHDARRLHYDLRLERDGALASWAVRRAARCAPASAISPSIGGPPSTTARSRVSSPRASTAPDRWRSGIEARTRCSEKRGGGLTFRPTGSGRGRTDARSRAPRGKEQNWLCFGRTPRLQPAPPSPQIATSAETLRAARAGSTSPSGRLSGDRRHEGGEATLTSRNGTNLTERFRRRQGGRKGGPDAVRCWTARSARSTTRERPLRGPPERLWPADPHGVRPARPRRPAVHGRPLVERRALLEEVLDPAIDAVRLSPAFEDGEALLEAAAAQGLEALSAKRADAPSGRAAARRNGEGQLRAQDDFPIVGYTRGHGAEGEVARSSSAGPEADGLHLPATSARGSATTTWIAFGRCLRPLERPSSPPRRAAKDAARAGADVTWVEPRLAAEVTYAEKTQEGRRRAPVFLGIRDDVPVERPPMPTEIKRGPAGAEVPTSTTVLARGGDHEGRAHSRTTAMVAEVLSPHLRRRPFTMKRYPDDGRARRFFRSRHRRTFLTGSRPCLSRVPRARARRRSSTTRSSTTSWRSSGWSTWAASTCMRGRRASTSPTGRDWVMFDLDPRRRCDVSRT